MVSAKSLSTVNNASAAMKNGLNTHNVLLKLKLNSYRLYNGKYQL